MNYRIKSKQKSLFKKLKFVARARKKDSLGIRFALDCLLFSKGKVYATDGHRLHCAEISQPFVDGLYEPVRNNSREIVLIPHEDGKDFPDVSEIFKSVPKDNPGLKLHDNLPIDYAHVVRNVHQNDTVNYLFIKDIITEIDGMHEHKKKGDMIFFKGVERVAILMPLTVGW